MVDVSPGYRTLPTRTTATRENAACPLYPLADRFASLDWVGRLHRWTRAVNPLLPEILARMTYPPRRP